MVSAPFPDLESVATPTTFTPTLPVHQVLVRITYAGINGGCETFRARGERAFASNASAANFPLGAEGAGVVVALGPSAVSGLAVGQAVAVNGAAAFAEYVVAKARLVTPVDEAGPEAVALVLSGVTACVALEVRQ
jgi:NADPH:quinone reductase-like Zn-dependent oxidoreductase